MKQRHAHKRHFLVVGGRRAASSRGEFTNGLGRVLVLRGGHEPQQSAGQILIAQRVRPARQQVSFGQSTDPVPGLGTGSPGRRLGVRPPADSQLTQPSTSA